MLLLLFFYVADVLAIEKEYPHYIFEDPHTYEAPMNSYEAELPAGDPAYENYGVSEFWWEGTTTKWLPWWSKMNVSIPTPGSRLPPSESDEGNTEPEKETTIETSGGENQTSIVTSETSEGANGTSIVTNETSEGAMTQNETVALTDMTIVSPEETSLDTSNTTELGVPTTLTAEDQTKTYTGLPQPEIDDVNLVAQLRAPDKPPNYDYYGELHDEVPPNVRGPEYPGLSPNIPVILEGTDNKTTVKKPPAIPGWRLQFPDRLPKSNKLPDGTPKLEKTTFKVNYPDYFNVINDGMKIEPLLDERTGRFQPDPNFEAKESKKSTASSVHLRSMDYPVLHDMHPVPDSEEDAFDTYSPKPFKFDEKAAVKELMALVSNAGPERMMKPPPTVKAVKALSPTYTVLHIETTGTPLTGPYITTRFTTEPTTTTRFTTEPTTTTSFTTEPTTTTMFTTESTTSTTEPPTTLLVTSTQPSTTTNYDYNIGYTSSEPAPPLPNYIQTYQVDWNAFSTMRSTFTTTQATMPTTTSHPLIEKLKNEMTKEQVGYFSVCLPKFVEIFSTKENNALRALLKGATTALAKMNKHNELVGLGRPMWPGSELGFLLMRLAPIEKVKSRAISVYKFYASGTAFDVKQLHDNLDNMFFQKEGEDMMQALTEFEEYPGINHDMNATKVMEHLFKSLLAPYLRDRNSPKMKSLLWDINNKLKIANEKFYANSRRNTPGESKYTSTINYNLKNKVANIESNSERSIDFDYIDDDDTSGIPINNFGGKETSNAVERRDGIDETKTIYDISEDIKTEKIDSVVMIGDSKKKSIKTIDYAKDTYFRMSKAKDKGPGIVDNKDSTTESSKKEKATKAIKCNDGGCIATDTNTVLKRASRKKYGQNEVRHRYVESKVRLIKDASEISGQVGHQKETEMGINVNHKVTEATILYHHDKYSSKNPKKYLKNYKNTKKLFKSSEGGHDNELFKDNKEKKTYYTNRAASGEPNDIKWYLEVIKYNKSQPKSYHEAGHKFDNISSKDKINLKTIAYHNRAEIGNRVKNKINEATNYYHNVKYGNKEPKKYPKHFKKATISSIKDVEDGLSKDIKINTHYKYYTRNGEPSDKKWYLDKLKYNKSETKPNNEKDNKIGYINTRDKINGKIKHYSGKYKEGPIFQTNGIKSQLSSTTRATVKKNYFSHKTTKKSYDYETYDDETESKIKKENKISINEKSGLSIIKDDDYDTFDDSKDSKEINHSKTTNIHRKEEPNNENAKKSWNSVKAKDYIKELRIRRTTKEKEYFRDIKQYYTTTISSNGETFRNKKINYIWSSSEKVDPTQTNTTIATENEVPGYENKMVLIDKENIKVFAPRAENDNSGENFISFENELKNKDQETILEQQNNQFNAIGSETKVKDTNIPENGFTRLTQRAPQKRFKKKQKPEVQNNEKHKYYRSTKPQDVYSEAPDFKQKDLGLKNKKTTILKKTEINKNKSSDYENNKKFWPHSKSQYIINEPAYLKERFRDFNRDNVQTKKKYNLRNIDKNKNILRVESSYSDEEEVLKSNLQDNLLHGGRKFTDTLHKYKKSNPIRDISSYSDEEDTLKKNIYKLFT